MWKREYHLEEREKGGGRGEDKRAQEKFYPSQRMT